MKPETLLNIPTTNAVREHLEQRQNIDNKKQQNLHLPQNIKAFTVSYLTQKEVEKFDNTTCKNKQKQTTNLKL